MKKVIYAVTKDGKEKVKVCSGVGYITDTDLITAQKSKNGNAYIRVYEDIVKDSRKIAGKDNEYRSWYSDIYEIDDKIIEVFYQVYFKII